MNLMNTENNWSRWLLMPLSLLYGVGVGSRLFLYQMGVLRPTSFDIPVISVGNLTVGGSGKTPHIEYLIRLLQPYIQVATLSRGYGRKTEGFWIVEPQHTAEEVGDEPLQFKRKFPDIQVAVGENRALSIPTMIQKKWDTQAILLDDAFQHLQVNPYLNILLSEYREPFYEDFLVPSGRLREWRQGYRRADIIIMSKCPTNLTPENRRQTIQKINPYPHQRIYFSTIQYGMPYSYFDPNYVLELTSSVNILLLCAIARADYLVDYVKEKVRAVKTMEFDDHRNFTNYDIAQMHQAMRNLSDSGMKNVFLLTTEKDAVRLAKHHDYLVQNNIHPFIIPIEVAFLFGEKEKFDKDIQQTLLDFKV